MKGNGLKYLFWSFSAILLFLILLASRDAGISCDEILHYDHSVAVLNYFGSGGTDTSALNTPVTNLKYYGQSYDNIVTFITRLLNIEDVYTFRNLMSAVMGWLTILITALFAVSLGNYRTGILVLFLFSVSPAFFGHSLNNLKDVPFAFAYIAGTWSITRFVSKGGKTSVTSAILLTLSIAFCISIRAGGLILICYLFMFLILHYVLKYYETRRSNVNELIRKASWIFAISLISVLLGSLLWPYALRDPLRNILESYRVMAHYPLTFRQIFEGRVEWSDFMPWYYLLKSMAITIPLLVLAGFVIFFFFSRKVLTGKSRLVYGFVVFTILFPLFFVIAERSNLYSSWRQFLFVYPAIVLLSASGISFLFDHIQKNVLQLAISAVVLLSALHPAIFMIKNHPYEYIYYNELAGGVKGAYGNYELDYYYTSQTEASKWLINYLEERNLLDDVNVSATYSVSWMFRNYPGVHASWLRWEERSMKEWDYAIVVNRYITPFQLKTGLWPPKNTIHVIKVEGIPICAVLKRNSGYDLAGYEALQRGSYTEAADYFSKAVKEDDTDEMIFYNFAAALYKSGNKAKADSMLAKSLELNPDFDLALMYKGNVAKADNRLEEAKDSYEKLIKVNRKYFEAYVSLAELVGDKDVRAARELLRTCLRLNPGYKPAISALGDTYIKSDPETARKYYEKAKTTININ